MSINYRKRNLQKFFFMVKTCLEFDAYALVNLITPTLFRDK
jgi:hypothetical protein